jgi:hypothetical protein
VRAVDDAAPKADPHWRMRSYFALSRIVGKPRYLTEVSDGC